MWPATIARNWTPRRRPSSGVVNAYHVASAATMITFAAVGAVFSYRRVYCIGLAIFTLTSIGCAVTNDLWTLVAFRSLQGFSYAAMVSIGIGMYRKIYPPELLGSILGINALIVALGTVAGPAGRHHRIDAGLALVVPDQRAVRRRGAVPGPAQPASGRGQRRAARPVQHRLLRAGHWLRGDRHRPGRTLGQWHRLDLAGLRRRAGHRVPAPAAPPDAPLLPLDIFASKRFSFAAAASLAAFSAQGISFVALPFLFQSVYGYSAIQSALLFTPWPVVVTVAAPLSGRLSDKINATLLSTIGVGIFALGLFLIASMDHARRHRHPVAPGPVRTGLRLFQAPNNKEMLSNVARARATSRGHGRTLGQSLGAAVVAVVLSGVASQLFASGKVGQMRTALWIASAIAMASCCLSLVRIHR